MGITFHSGASSPIRRNDRGFRTHDPHGAPPETQQNAVFWLADDLGLGGIRNQTFSDVAVFRNRVADAYPRLSAVFECRNGI